MNITNPPKALIVLVALICLTVLMATHTIDSTTGAGMLGTIIGYGVGNGIAAKRGETVDPIFGKKDKP